MSNEHYNIDDIERYLDGQMDIEEATSFTTSMETDPKLQVEVQAYGMLIEGFHAYADERFQESLSEWELGWSTSAIDDSELIEWYLNDQLGAGTALIDDRIQNDKNFALEVKKQKKLQEGFEAIRNEQFIEKMESWEKEPVESDNIRQLKPRNTKQYSLRRIAAAIIIVISAAGVAYWYANANYSQATITAELFEAPRSENVMGEAKETLSQLTQMLERSAGLLENKKYDEAFLSFDQLLDQINNQAELDEFNRTYYKEEAEWYRLLAAQAMKTPPMEIDSEVKRIASTQGHSHQEDAKKLQHKMQSFWYRLVN